MNNPPQVIVSTDITGVLGNPLKVVSAYAQSLPLLSPDKPLGVELIAWRQLSLSRFLSSRPKPIRIVGIHGRMGPPATDQKEFLFSAVNACLATTKNLLRHLSDSHYLLFHQQEALLSWNLLSTAPKKGSIFIENNDRLNSLEQTLQIVSRLSKFRPQAGIMIDLVHLLAENTLLLPHASFDTLWDKTLSDSNTALKKVAIGGFHLPIGTDRDSLPLGQFQSRHWRQLSSLIHTHSHIRYLVIENHHDATQIYLGDRQAATLSSRNHRVLSRLHRHSII